MTSPQYKKNSDIRQEKVSIFPLILTILSIIIAIIALIFTYQQNSSAREHNRRSVTPQINAYFSDNTDNLFGVYVVNNGLGTALITDLEVFVNNKEIIGDSQTKFVEAINRLGLDQNCFVIAIPRNGDTLSINKEYPFIKIKNRETKCKIGQILLHHLGTKFNFTLYYESLYGEKFKYTYLENKQVKL